jgi:hypothetical protein
MKILLLTLKHYSVISDNDINIQPAIYAYFFKKYLLRYPNIELKIDNFEMTPSYAETLETFDFCIITVNRGVLLLNPNVYKILRQ